MHINSTQEVCEVEAAVTAPAHGSGQSPPWSRPDKDRCMSFNPLLDSHLAGREGRVTALRTMTLAFSQLVVAKLVIEEEHILSTTVFHGIFS